MTDYKGNTTGPGINFVSWSGGIGYPSKIPTGGKRKTRKGRKGSKTRKGRKAAKRYSRRR